MHRRRAFLASIVSILLALPLALLFSSCDLLGEEEREDLQPLAVGNTWHYTGWYLRETLSFSFRAEITRKVELTHEGRRVRTYALQLFYEDDVPSSVSAPLYANGPQGLYLWGRAAETDTVVVPHLIRRYPAQVGDSWPFIRIGFNPYEGEHVIIDTLDQTLVAKDEVIETPAGTFRCYVYKYSFLPADDVASVWNVYDYYAPGVGNVAQIIKSQGPGEPESPDIKQQVLLESFQVE